MKRQKRKYRKRKILIIIICILLLTFKWYTSRPRENTFSSMILSAQTDMISLEQTDEVLNLLEKYKPRIYTHKDSYKPLDFYNDYLPNTVLKKSGFFDSKLSIEMNKETLLEYSNNSNYYLDYIPSYKEELKKMPNQAVPIYGRAYKSVLKSENDDINLIYLKYSLVYPYSGLPASISGGKRLAANIIGNPNAWHELDIHGAIHIILFEDTLEAAGVLLAQHNHHKAYIFDENFIIPKDNSIRISISKMSNEPYLMSDDNKSRIERTVGNPTDLEFLLGISDDVPLTAGYDYIPSLEESIEIESYVEQLNLDDPLYRSTMSLGKIKKILGITRSFFLDGPPGMDFYAMPDFIDLSELSAFANIELTEGYIDIYNRSEYGFFKSDIDELMHYQRNKLYKDLMKLKEVEK